MCMSKEVEVVVARHDGTHVDIIYLFSIYTHAAHSRKCYINARVLGVHPPAGNHLPTNAGVNGSRVRANHPRRHTTKQPLYIYISWRHGAWLLVAPGALPSIRS